MVKRRGRADIHGLLLVDKPAEASSAAAVAKIKSRFRLAKVGHAGTLDPLATGLLPICINEGTKLSGLLSERGKRYATTLKLGESTDTQDTEGEIIQQRPVTVRPEELSAVLGAFLGEHDQLPPMYSAKKREGRPLYELARQGETVERETVRVSVYVLEMIDFSPPFITLELEASKGFYVRTLCHDIGERLGCGAHMVSLRRLRHGPFDIADAIALEELLDGGEPAFNQALMPLTHPAIGIPLLPLDAAALAKIDTGQPLSVADLRGLGDGAIPGGTELLRGVDPEGRLRALLRVQLEPSGWLQAKPATVALSIERGFRIE